MSGRRRALDVGVLVVLGGGVVALTAWSATWELAREHPGPFAAVVAGQLALCGAAAAWIAWRRPAGRGALAVVFLAALAARLVLVPHAPDVSGDINRYVWDGRVQAAGINPYRYAPADPEVARFRDDAVYPGINRKPVPTIYPPVAEASFLGLHLVGARSVTALKLALVLLEMAAVAALALLLARTGRLPAGAVLYAWHPLAILEVGRSGHVDALAVLALVGALLAHAVRRPLLAGVALAAATMVKLYAAIALPALVWSGGRRRPATLAAFAAAIVVGYLPYLGVGAGVLGYLPGYLDEEGFDSGRRFYLLARLDDAFGLDRVGPFEAAQVYQALVLACLAGAAAWCWWRPPVGVRASVDRALGLMLVAFVLTTPTYPWYMLMLLVLAPAASAALAGPALFIGSSATLLYLQWWLPGAPTWPLHVTWGLGAAALALAGLHAAGRLRRSARPPGVTSLKDPSPIIGR